MLNKQALVEKIIAALTVELDGYLHSAKAARAGATDDQSRAENKYDTRGLEAGYLANGQSRLAAEILEGIEHYRSLPLRAFSAGEPIGMGALVELEKKGEKTAYFIGQYAGGTEIEGEGRTVLVITPQSPMGRQLLNRREGEEVQIRIGPASETYQVVAVR